MAKTPLGDIPGARFHFPGVSNGAVASNGANGLVGAVGPLAFDGRLRNLWFTPTAGNQGANTASYRLLKLINGGTGGAGTAVMASLALSASHASMVPVPMVVDTTQTAASGSIFFYSQETVGGTDATGTVLQAGRLEAAYEIL